MNVGEGSPQCTTPGKMKAISTKIQKRGHRGLIARTIDICIERFRLLSWPDCVAGQQF